MCSGLEDFLVDEMSPGIEARRNGRRGLIQVTRIDEVWEEQDIASFDGGPRGFGDEVDMTLCEVKCRFALCVHKRRPQSIMISCEDVDLAATATELDHKLIQCHECLPVVGEVIHVVSDKNYAILRSATGVGAQILECRSAILGGNMDIRNK